MLFIIFRWKYVNRRRSIVVLFIIIGFIMDLSRSGCLLSIILGFFGRLCWVGRVRGGREVKGRGRSFCS